MESSSAVSALSSIFAVLGQHLCSATMARTWALLSLDRGLLAVFRHHLGPQCGGMAGLWPLLLLFACERCADEHFLRSCHLEGSQNKEYPDRLRPGARSWLAGGPWLEAWLALFCMGAAMQVGTKHWQVLTHSNVWDPHNRAALSAGGRGGPGESAEASGDGAESVHVGI